VGRNALALLQLPLCAAAVPGISALPCSEKNTNEFCEAKRACSTSKAQNQNRLSHDLIVVHFEETASWPQSNLFMP
jgi:hypothetical protein